MGGRFAVAYAINRCGKHLGCLRLDVAFELRDAPTVRSGARLCRRRRVAGGHLRLDRWLHGARKVALLLLRGRLEVTHGRTKRREETVGVCAAKRARCLARHVSVCESGEQRGMELSEGSLLLSREASTRGRERYARVVYKAGVGVR